MLGLVEAVIEDPEVILRAQVDKLKTQKIAELKAAGVEYDQRMAELEKIEHPKPNAEFLYSSFAAFAADHPWVVRESLKPKSVAREMVEMLQPFGGYIKEYGSLARRGSFCATSPRSTRLWSRLSRSRRARPSSTTSPSISAASCAAWTRACSTSGSGCSTPSDCSRTSPWKSSSTTSRATAARSLPSSETSAFRFCAPSPPATTNHFQDLVETGEATLAVADVERALRPLFEAGETIRLDAVARNPQHTTLEPGDDYWRVSQSILVGDEISEYVITGRIDLARSRTLRRAVLLLDHVGAV